MKSFPSFWPFKLGRKRKGKNPIIVDTQKLLAISICVDDEEGLLKLFSLNKGDNMALIFKVMQVAQPIFVDGIVQLAQTGDLKNFGTGVFNDCSFDGSDGAFMFKTMVDEKIVSSSASMILQQFSIDISDDKKYLKSFHVTLAIFLKSQANENGTILILNPKSPDVLVAK